MVADDTIVAVASAPGRAGIGVVRVSGAHVPAIATGVLGGLPVPRRASLRTFRDGDGEAIDEGIALYFPAPGTYTGEDLLELHTHGSPAVLRQLVQRCLALGARPAEPGEFTRRAFLNGKLDLAQAEAVADLIDAGSVQAARSALRSLRGEFSRLINALGERLTRLRVLVEAHLDFVEEDVGRLSDRDLLESLDAIAAELAGIERTAQQGSLLREGMQVVLAGRPNVGKSSIINALAMDEVAIVTAVPGTTRDPVRQSISIRGVPVHVTDTAGLRETGDPVETLGIERTWRAIEAADVVLWVVDDREGVTPADQAVRDGLPSERRVVCVRNKIDLSGRAAGIDRTADGVEVRLSALSGAGMDLLADVLLEAAGRETGIEAVFMARERHLQALRECARHLEDARASVGQLELFAEHLRLAHRALGTITGEVTSDDLLGEIFATFCIGK